MPNLTSDRERVILVLYQALLASNNYELDDLARSILDLPPRPDGAMPFVGWLLPQQKLSDSSVKSTSIAGINFIKRWEGFRSNAYLCPANVLTIGYGHTKSVVPNQVISEREAELLLTSDLVRFERAVNNLVTVPLNQKQFDALVSFAFNCGVSAFQRSTLLRRLNEGDYKAASKEFHKWVRAGRKVLPGLVTRRREESQLFNS
jgi:lysozyme